MLTKQDLNDITKVVQATVITEINKAEIRIDNRFQLSLQKELKPVKRELKKLYKNQNMIIGFFDNTYAELRTRVEKIEQIILH